MGCFSLGVICDKVEDVNELIYPFHNEFIGYYPKDYYENNKEERKYLSFEKFSRDIESEWGKLLKAEKEKFNFSIERFADVKYGYYYNDDRSDIGYYKNENGKMICFTVGGKFSDMLNVKNAFGGRRKATTAKVKNIIVPDRKEKFGTYAIINDGKWISVDDYDDRDEWFNLHFRRFLKKIDPNKLFVVVECCYTKEKQSEFELRNKKVWA
ncbi:hypothetical protein [uncultured Clostridium sp.]|uniref:hypothetical protein n=1 Tax=uncultured Clostridium sp. TaxID=59620 RepID=UPI00262E6E88|nr:hypothetical protein [uncultured Clostridium sp.]